MSLFKRGSTRTQSDEPKSSVGQQPAHLSSFRPGALIPPEVLQKHIEFHNSEQSFEALRLKVQKADEEARRKEEMARLIAERQGLLQDPGHNDQLGQLHFKLLYDVGREALRVTLVEAAQLRPRDPLGVVLNVRTSVTLESTRGPPNTIKPRPKLGILNKLAHNRGTDFSAGTSAGGRLPTKTETVDPASTSIYWRTHKPVWNEDFIFEGIQNRQLKRLAVVFTVYERHAAKPPEPPQDEFIGECRIPLVKIHKKLAGPSPSNIDKQRPSNVPRIEGNKGNNNEHSNAAAAAEDAVTEEVAGSVQPEVEIPLPTTCPMKQKSIINQWFERFEDPIPGQDGEMEELESLCNSEAVHEELKDPELMDSISVRELRMATAENKARLQTIKELAMPQEPRTPTPLDPMGGGVDNFDFEDSEAELSERSRPCVIRTLEGWHYINQVPRLRPVYGEIEIGLNHEPNLGRVTLSIIKGINLVAPDSSLMTVWVSVQKKTRTFRKTTPFSAVAPGSISSKSRSARGNVVGGGGRDSSGGPVQITDKAGKLRRTKFRTETSDPVWDDRFEFNVSREQLQTVCFDILVYNKDVVVGGVRLGHIASYRASRHWDNMTQRPGSWVSQTYILQ